jgi:hypothetical protein
MPKIYEYFGLIFLFHTRGEHNPVHVHVQYGEYENKVELIYIKGKLSEINFIKVRGKKEIPKSKLNEIRTFINKCHLQITKKWINLFIKNIKPKFEKITQKV